MGELCPLWRLNIIGELLTELEYDVMKPDLERLVALLADHPFLDYLGWLGARLACRRTSQMKKVSSRTASFRGLKISSFMRRMYSE
jgi:hypothetical protein